MNFRIYAMFCEYLLLENHLKGLSKEDFVKELTMRGCPDFYVNNVTIVGHNQTGLNYTDELLQLNKDAYLNPKIEHGVIKGDLSQLMLNLHLFYKYHENETKEFNHNVEEGIEEVLNDLPGDGNQGNIYLDLERDGKFRFYPGYANTPMSWTYHINLLEVGRYLMQYNIWFTPKKEQTFMSKKNLYFSIATWFWKKFKRPFYDIHEEAHRYYEDKGSKVEPLKEINRKLRGIMIPS